MWETYTVVYEYTWTDNSYPMGWFDRPKDVDPVTPKKAEEKSKDIGED